MWIRHVILLDIMFFYFIEGNGDCSLFSTLVSVIRIGDIIQLCIGFTITWILVEGIVASLGHLF